jgi:hypothetical protein
VRLWLLCRQGRWDDAAQLFAADGTLELAGRGVYVGRERVREYLRHLPAYGYGVLYNHMQLQPVIHIDCVAGTARGRLRSFRMVGALDAEARWGEAPTEQYRIENGRWRIAPCGYEPARTPSRAGTKAA